MYELLTIIAIIFVSTGVFLWFAGDATAGPKRWWLQTFLWLTVGAYYVWCWHKSGRTLAMQAWNLSLIKFPQGLTPPLSSELPHTLLGIQAAMIRYVLATFSLSLAGLGFLWVFVDKDRRFLHDRLLHSKIVQNLQKHDPIS